MTCSAVVPCSPLPGSHCVAPASANAPSRTLDVVPGALTSTFLRPALASPSAALASVARLWVGSTFRLVLVEQQRRKSGDAGEASAIDRVQPVGDGGNFGRVEAALVAAVENVAVGADARQQGLGVAGALRRRAGLAGLVVVEHGPDSPAEGPGRGVGLVPGDLPQMAEMAEVRPALWVARAQAMSTATARSMPPRWTALQNELARPTCLVMAKIFKPRRSASSLSSRALRSTASRSST